MKKKIFLTSACALLAVSGVWAEDVTNNNTGVTYTVLSSTSNSTTGDVTLENNNLVVSTFNKGYITLEEEYSQENENNEIYSIKPISFSAINGTLDLSGWEKSTSKNTSPKVNATKMYFEPEYATYMALAAEKNSNIQKLTDAANGKNLKIYNSNADMTVTMSYSDFVTNLNNNGVSENNVYVYVVTDFLFGNSYNVLTTINYNKTTQLSTSTNKTYRVTTLPTSFIDGTINSLIIPSTLTTIEDGAFTNASNLNSITANGGFVVDNNILYNSTRTKIYFVLPAASESTISIPNSVTAIDANAFDYTHDMVVNLGSGCTSYSGGTNNTFIGGTLTEGMITNAMLSDANIYTITGAVTSIQAGAFKNAGNLVAFNVNQNSNYKYENGILYNADYTTVIAAIPGVASQTLPNTVTTVLNYAFANTKTPINIYVAKNISEGTGHNNVTFVKPSASLRVTPVGDGNDGYSVSGNITQSNFDAMVGGIQGTYMDFTNCNVMEPLTIENNSNTLLYFTTSQAVTGNNVINNGTCANLVIKDEAHTKFYCPTRFTATKASYDREMPANWSTICLPFNAAGATVENNFAIGKLTGFNEAENSFTVTYQTSMSAYVPYAIKRESKTPVALQFDNAEVPVTTDPITEAGQGKFTGVLETTVVSCDATWYHYGFTKTGTYARCNNATFHPFRAYFTAAKTYFDNVNAASAGSMRMIDGNNNEMIVVELDNTTDIQSMGMENKEEVIYNMNGQRVKEINAKGMYVVNGKKVMINK